MKSIIIPFLSLLLFATGCRKDDLEITQVKVWDKDFQVINTITNSSDISTLKNIWKDKATTSTRPTFTHKIDISTPEGSVRWLYNPEGFVTILDVWRSTVYRFNKSEELKEILIPNHRVDPARTTRVD